VLLTISTTHRPATDLGFLLHKNPERRHLAELGFGTAQVFYPEASEVRCSAAVLLDIDPVGLVARRRMPAGNQFALSSYVNDRPYAASSFLAVALGRLFGTAMSGRSKERQELADQAIPLEISMPVVPCRGGEPLARRLFEPLGYAVEAAPLPLDTEFPAWGDSPYLSLRLTATVRLRDGLGHLFVLLPVLDDDKHYWVSADEVDKLLRRGGEWLAAHPEHELITRRYLRHDQRLTRDALVRLFEEEVGDPDRADEQADAAEESVERTVSLQTERLDAVLDVIRSTGAREVLDLGCGSGRLLAALLAERGLQRIVGMDVSYRALQSAARRIHLDTMAPRQRSRVELLQGSLTYTDSRLRGFDAAAVVEVIEHLDPPRLGAFERALFGYAQPGTVIMTTPNAEYNRLFTGLAAGEMRHRDHRFEWTREQFAQWSAGVAARHGYQAELSGIGPADPISGSPSQLAVFRR
jgi:3' terminal RNA ribose 2'-O-methyltransferase Hen1